MSVEAFFADAVAELRDAELFRSPDDALARLEVAERARNLGVGFLDASSNDYLGLAEASVSRETLVQLSTHPVGAGASRLVQGTSKSHLDLEELLADWVGQASTLLFSSGFSANAGTVAALGTSNSTIISDALNHASLVDGCRLARAEVRVVPHLDLRAIEAELIAAKTAKMRWVVTESYFSMDGDSPDLRSLRALCDQYAAGLVVDEAHALGVFGQQGAGLCAAAGIRPDVLIGTLGKSVGSQGAFVAGSHLLRAFLWNRARTFVFSTAPSPLLAALAFQQVRTARDAEATRRVLDIRCQQLRAQLAEAGLFVPLGSHGPIVPVVLGDNRRALRVASDLRALGILAQPIRPPTVPHGSARIRVTVKATFSEEDVARLGAAIVRTCAAS